MLKQPLSNSKITFKKSRKIGFLGPENRQNDPLRRPTFIINFDFRGHIVTFRTENTT